MRFYTRCFIDLYKDGRRTTKGNPKSGVAGVI